jgi:hypothetical protein
LRFAGVLHIGLIVSAFLPALVLFCSAIDVGCRSWVVQKQEDTEETVMIIAWQVKLCERM